VPATSATFLDFFLFFLLWLLTVLMKKIRQAVHLVKQSVLLRCLWVNQPLGEGATTFSITAFITMKNATTNNKILSIMTSGIKLSVIHTEYRAFYIAMLNVFMVGVIMLGVSMLSISIRCVLWCLGKALA
jgi:hypothetical protein